MQVKKGSFVVSYTKKDLSYINKVLEGLEETKEEVLKFLEVEKLEQPCCIYFWDSAEAYLEFIHAELELDEITVGGITRFTSLERNSIHILSYEEMIQCEGHLQDSIEDYIKILNCEVVKGCYEQFLGYEQGDIAWFREGFSSYLVKRFESYQCKLDGTIECFLDSSDYFIYYYTLFYYVIHHYSHDYVLRLAKDQQYLLRETPRLFLEACSYVKKIEHDKVK